LALGWCWPTPSSPTVPIPICDVEGRKSVAANFVHVPLVGVTEKCFLLIKLNGKN